MMFCIIKSYPIEEFDVVFENLFEGYKINFKVFSLTII
jgi:hypothetical protein